MPTIALERVIGLTSQHRCALAAHPSSGETAYAAGCVVVLLNPKKNRQTRYFRASKPIASLAFSRCGRFLAVGERGHKPAAIVWELKTGTVKAEMKGHKHGIACIAFSPQGNHVVTVGFRYDRTVLLWDWRRCSDRPMSRGKVSQRIFAVEFTPNGHFFVTCGEKHVKFWDAFNVLEEVTSDETAECRAPPLPPPQENVSNNSSAPLPPPPPSRALSLPPSVQEGTLRERRLSKPPSEPPKMPQDLRGRLASIVESQRGAIFIDVACTEDGKVYAVTTDGVLSAFNASTARIESYVSMEASTAYSLSVQHSGGGHVGALLAVGCSDGLVRLFEANGLRYVITLPLPPPVGHLNVSSIEELTQLTDENERLISHQRQTDLEAKGESAKIVDSASRGEKIGSSARENTIKFTNDRLLRYPGCLALSWLCKLRTGNSVDTDGDGKHAHLASQLVAIYGDRSFFVWDITVTHASRANIDTAAASVTEGSKERAAPTIVIGKYRSFIHHAACIWDVQPLPPFWRQATAHTTGGLVRCADGITNLEFNRSSSNSTTTFATCAADNTVRIWHLESTNGSTTTTRSNMRDSDTANGLSYPRNFFSREMVHALKTDTRDIKNSGEQELIVPEATVELNDRNGAPRVENAASNDMGGAVIVDSLPDLETPCKVDNKESPRTLAVSPEGEQIACGDRLGNLRVWRHACREGADRKPYELLYAAAAHDAEILSLDFTRAPAIKAASATSSCASDSDESDLMHGFDSLLASGSRDRLIHILGSRSSVKKEHNKNDQYHLVQTLENHESAVTAIKFSMDGERLFSCGSDGILALSRVQCTDKLSLPSCSSNIGGEDGQSNHKSKLALQLQLKNYKKVNLVHGAVYDVAGDASGKYVLTAGEDRQLHIYSAASGKHVRCYSADMRPAPGTQPMENPRGNNKGAEVYKIAVCPAGMYTAVCTFDKWIRLFDFYSGECVAQVAGHAELVTGICFTPDGKRLISVGGDGCVFIWKLNAAITAAISDRLQELELQRQNRRERRNSNVPLSLIDQNSSPAPSGIQAKHNPVMTSSVELKEDNDVREIGESTLNAQTFTGDCTEQFDDIKKSSDQIEVSINDGIVLGEDENPIHSLHPSLLGDSILEQNVESGDGDVNIHEAIDRLASSNSDSQLVQSLEDSDGVQIAESPRYAEAKDSFDAFGEPVSPGHQAKDGYDKDGDDWSEYSVADLSSSASSVGATAVPQCANEVVSSLLENSADDASKLPVVDVDEGNEEETVTGISSERLCDEVRRSWSVNSLGEDRIFRENSVVEEGHINRASELEKDVASLAIPKYKEVQRMSFSRSFREGNKTRSLPNEDPDINTVLEHLSTQNPECKFDEMNLAASECKLTQASEMLDTDGFVSNAENMFSKLPSSTEDHRSPPKFANTHNDDVQQITVPPPEVSMPEPPATPAGVTKPSVPPPAPPPVSSSSSSTSIASWRTNATGIGGKDMMPSNDVHSRPEPNRDENDDSVQLISSLMPLETSSTPIQTKNLTCSLSSDIAPNTMSSELISGSTHPHLLVSGPSTPSKMSIESCSEGSLQNKTKESSQQRTLLQERERLKMLNKHRDTASALQSMNEQLRNMGIIPTSSSINEVVNEGNSFIFPLQSAIDTVLPEFMSTSPSSCDDKDLEMLSQPPKAMVEYYGSDHDKADEGHGNLSEREDGYSQAAADNLNTSKSVTSIPAKLSIPTTQSIVSKDLMEDKRLKLFGSPAKDAISIEECAHAVDTKSDGDNNTIVCPDECRKANTISPTNTLAQDRQQSLNTTDIPTACSELDSAGVPVNMSGRLPRTADEYRRSLQRLQAAALETAQLYSELQEAYHSNTAMTGPSSLTSEQWQDSRSNNNMILPKVTNSSHPSSDLNVNIDSKSTSLDAGSNLSALLGEFARTLQNIGNIFTASSTINSNKTTDASNFFSGKHDENKDNEFDEVLGKNGQPLASPSLVSASLPDMQQVAHAAAEHRNFASRSVDVGSSKFSNNLTSLTPILERVESHGYAVNSSSISPSTPGSEDNSATSLASTAPSISSIASTTVLPLSPPSRVAPPPPVTNLSTFPSVYDSNSENRASSDEGIIGVEDTNRRSRSEALPSPEVSQILEKYSDLLLEAVQQKLLAGHSGTDTQKINRK